MKLNDDLVRDILLAVETSTGESQEALDAVRKLISEEISDKVLIYHVRLLKNEGFIEASFTRADSGDYYLTWVDDLTWKGQQFLKNIRDEKVWKKAKKTAFEKFGEVSLDILSELAGAIIRKSLLDS